MHQSHPWLAISYCILILILMVSAIQFDKRRNNRLTRAILERLGACREPQNGEDLEHHLAALQPVNLFIVLYDLEQDNVVRAWPPQRFAHLSLTPCYKRRFALTQKGRAILEQLKRP